MGIFSLTTLSTMAEKAVKPYWQDVQVVEVNKEYPRTSFMTYNNRADALSGKFERSKYYRLLNGTWKFYFVDSYKKLPENITDPNTNTDSWDDIQVPGNWEVQGHGIAIYTSYSSRSQSGRSLSPGHRYSGRLGRAGYLLAFGRS